MRKKRTDRLPTAVTRPAHLRSEVFQEMTQRVEKEKRSPERAYAHLRETAVVEPPERHPLRWIVAGLAVVAAGAAGWIYWDWIIGLFG